MQKAHFPYICIHITRQRTDRGFSICEHAYKDSKALVIISGSMAEKSSSMVQTVGMQTHEFKTV